MHDDDYQHYREEYAADNDLMRIIFLLSELEYVVSAG